MRNVEGDTVLKCIYVSWAFFLRSLPPSDSSIIALHLEGHKGEEREHEKKRLACKQEKGH